MRAYIKIDGSESELQSLSYQFNREVGDNGQINSRVKRGILTVTKDSSPMKAFMINWMSEQDQEKEIEITIYEDDKKETPFKVVKIEKARIFNYQEAFDRDGNARVYETFSISGELVHVGDSAKFDFYWPKDE